MTSGGDHHGALSPVPGWGWVSWRLKSGLNRNRHTGMASRKSMVSVTSIVPSARSWCSTLRSYESNGPAVARNRFGATRRSSNGSRPARLQDRRQLGAVDDLDGDDGRHADRLRQGLVRGGVDRSRGRPARQALVALIRAAGRPAGWPATARARQQGDGAADSAASRPIPPGEPRWRSRRCAWSEYRPPGGQMEFCRVWFVPVLAGRVSPDQQPGVTEPSREPCVSRSTRSSR